MEKLIDMFTPKAHSEIDSLINQPIEGMDDDFIMNLAMGVAGGGGANIGKAAKNIITKILSRNSKSIRNLKSGTRTGAQTMSPENKEFMSEGWRKWSQLTDELSTTKNPEMRKYISSLRQDLSPHYKGPRGGWYQGRYNPNYDPPSGKDIISNMLEGLLIGLPVAGLTQRVIGDSDVPNIGRPPKLP